jgi:hypothetical protein
MNSRVPTGFLARLRLALVSFDGLGEALPRTPDSPPGPGTVLVVILPDRPAPPDGGNQLRTTPCQDALASRRIAALVPAPDGSPERRLAIASPAVTEAAASRVAGFFVTRLHFIAMAGAWPYAALPYAAWPAAVGQRAGGS